MGPLEVKMRRFKCKRWKPEGRGREREPICLCARFWVRGIFHVSQSTKLGQEAHPKPGNGEVYGNRRDCCARIRPPAAVSSSQANRGTHFLQRHGDRHVRLRLHWLLAYVLWGGNVAGASS